MKKLLILIGLSIGVISILGNTARAIEFPDAPKREAPQSTAAGGRRGGCVSGTIPITPLTPSKDNQIKTVSPQPQFFVYIPPTKAKLAQFILKDDEGKSLDTQEIAIEKGDYVLDINVGKNINLETGKKYNWEISLICNPMVINTSNYSKGSIERVSLDDTVKAELLKDEDILKQAQIYANNNIWQETISLAASIKNDQPQEWQELLTSVGLENLVNKPLNISSDSQKIKQ